MANDEHLRVVKQGAKTIEEWRRSNPAVPMDLTGAKLSGADLSEANLSGADLTGARLSGAELNAVNLAGANLGWADLSGAKLSRGNLAGANLTKANLSGANIAEANLSGAKLTGANLTRADLSEANLGGADLTGAILTRTNLSGADLSSAKLTRADLSGANLNGANFAEAWLGFTSIATCDLSQARGLVTVKHRGPSSIGADTIIMSGGNIPRAFLEGAGLPSTWIEYIPWLTNSPLHFYSVFLAHSSEDQEFADKLYGSLKEKGVRVWCFPTDERDGPLIEEEIYQAIMHYDKVMAVCSREALASPRVRNELEQAVQNQQKAPNLWILLPVAIDDAVYKEEIEVARHLRRHVIEDFRLWRKPKEYQKALDRLLTDLVTRERPPLPAS